MARAPAPAGGGRLAPGAALSGLDKVLCILAAAVAVGALVGVARLITLFPK
jgi:hypothetical protein